MATFRIPVDAYVWTSAGPWRVGDLSATAKLVIIRPDGRPATTTIQEVSPPADRETVVLLADSGEIHLEARSVISTRGAQLFATAAASETIAGRGPRIELAHPQSLPYDPPDGDQVTATRNALALLEPSVIRVPRRLQADIGLRQLLEAAGVAFRDVSDDRWTALTFNPTDTAVGTGPPSAHEAKALQAVTAWASRPDGTVCRTPTDQIRLRHRLVAALAAAGTPAAVSWSPTYGPVEARICAGGGDVFTTATGVRQLTAACIDIQVEDEGSAVTDLAIVRARPSRDKD